MSNSWKKAIYISKKKAIAYDDFGKQIIEYEEPKKYFFNVQPINSQVDLMEFGEKSNMMQKAVISIKYKNEFKENDLAYLDGTTPESEVSFGEKANYRLYPPRNQNKVIVIYFERMTGK